MAKETKIVERIQKPLNQHDPLHSLSKKHVKEAFKRVCEEKAVLESLLLKVQKQLGLNKYLLQHCNQTYVNIQKQPGYGNKTKSYMSPPLIVIICNRIDIICNKNEKKKMYIYIL